MHVVFKSTNQVLTISFASLYKKFVMLSERRIRKKTRYLSKENLLLQLMSLF